MSSSTQSQRRKLPQVWRHLMWHPESGLVVSPFSRTLPLSVASSNRLEDQKKPRLLTDDKIHLAFYPRRPLHRSHLFSALGLSDRDLYQSINVTDVEGLPSYALGPVVQQTWVDLENSLLNVAEMLRNAHPRRASFPLLPTLRLPYEYGYAAGHSSKEVAFSCAKKSRNAFSTLSAYVSFFFSLWLSKYEDDSLDDAFALLSQNHPRVWLQYLKESIVCQFTPGLRPGGYLNPYTTRWGPFLEYPTRASVPIWLMWGNDYRGLEPDDKGMAFYLPPEQYVDIAKRRQVSFANTILPSQQTYFVEIRGHLNPVPLSGPTLHIPNNFVLPTSEVAQNDSYGLDGVTFDNPDAYVSNNNPDDPPPPAPAVDRTNILDPGSGQRAGESWEEFFKRQTEQLQRRIENENVNDKQRREALTKVADGGPSNKSSVFLWEQDEVLGTFYRRTRVTKSEAYSQWRDCTRHQRFFWPHTNQWDLCPHLPTGEPRRNNPYDTESDDDDELPQERATKPVAVPVVQAMLQTVRKLTARDEEPKNLALTFASPSLLRYLSRRHGFFADVKESWHPNLHDHEEHKYCLARDSKDLVLKNLLYTSGVTPSNAQTVTSIVDFYNIVLGPKLTYRALPGAWDISRQSLIPPLFCDLKRINLQRVRSALLEKTDLYILRPAPGSTDLSPWFIATTSATAVLFVYRSPWNTMFEIGRGLLDQGIPFRTVVERKRHEEPSQSWRYQTRGLGSRPKDFRPAFEGGYRMY